MKGIVYSIQDIETKEQYVGSTTLSLIKRLSYHARSSNKCSAKIILDRDNYEIKILEKIEISTRRILREKEQEWMDKYSDTIINKRRAIPKLQEWENPYYFN